VNAVSGSRRPRSAGRARVSLHARGRQRARRPEARGYRPSPNAPDARSPEGLKSRPTPEAWRPAIRLPEAIFVVPRRSFRKEVHLVGADSLREGSRARARPAVP